MTYPLNIALQKPHCSVYEADEKKYRVCLQMVQTILERELNIHLQTSDIELFADTAHFIDSHLDDMSIDEKFTLKEHFAALFKLIHKSNHFVLFHHQICSFIDLHSIQIKEVDYGLNKLFQLIQFCKKKDLLNELEDFASQIIDAGIKKHKAKTSKEIIAVLEKEGNAATTFLSSWIGKSYTISNDRIEKVLKYLKPLEHCLNVADDMLDVKSDKENGLINTDFGFIHRFQLGITVLKKFGLVVINYPLQSTKDSFTFIKKMVIQ